MAAMPYYDPVVLSFVADYSWSIPKVVQWFSICSRTINEIIGPLSYSTPRGGI